MAIYYLVYQLTNTVNGKIYIGCHMTKDMDDGYMGSGRRLAYAKKKYGEAAFKKQILSVHDTPDEMLAEERRLVNEEFLGRADVYNLAVGGQGSWFYVNSSRANCYPKSGNPKVLAALKKAAKASWDRRKADPEFDALVKASVVAGRRKFIQDHGNWWSDRKFTDQHKIAQREAFERIGHQQGEKNSQFGSRWVSHLSTKQSKRVKGEVPEGWVLGRNAWNK